MRKECNKECNILLELSEEGRPFWKPRYPGGRTKKLNMPEKNVKRCCFGLCV
jgi:hypothetical protein